jgi:hypothetical protein
MNSNIKLLDCHETASLSKFWYEIDGKKYLVKGNHVGNTEPIMEVLSANLLDVLNYPHAEYEIGVMNDFQEIVPADWLSFFDTEIVTAKTGRRKISYYY